MSLKRKSCSRVMEVHKFTLKMIKDIRGTCCKYASNEDIVTGDSETKAPRETLRHR